MDNVPTETWSLNCTARHRQDTRQENPSSRHRVGPTATNGDGAGEGHLGCLGKGGRSPPLPSSTAGELNESVTEGR